MVRSVLRNGAPRGIEAYDRDPSGIGRRLPIATTSASDDQVTIYLDTFQRPATLLLLRRNRWACRTMACAPKRLRRLFPVRHGGPESRFLYQTSGHITSTGWVVEMRDPVQVAAVRLGNVQTGASRRSPHPADAYEDTWTTSAVQGVVSGPVGDDHGTGHQARGFTELQPTVTADLPGRRVGAAFERDDAALDCRRQCAIRIHQPHPRRHRQPRFLAGQSDAGLVTINERLPSSSRAAPFFLEGIELFASPNNLGTPHNRESAGRGEGAGKFGKVTGPPQRDRRVRGRLAQRGWSTSPRGAAM